MPFSEVPRIELNGDGTVTLYVKVGGFDAGTPVEISGHATQTNGAMATFRDVQIMPDNSEQGAILVVRDVPVIGPNGFTAGDPVVAVAQAADIWLTKLDPDTDKKVLSQEIMAAKQLSAQINIQAAWNSDEMTYHSAFSSASWPAKSPSATTLLRHGTWWDRVKGDPLDVVMGGRFTRLFPHLPGARFTQTDLKRLAEVMIAPPEPESILETEQDPEENPGIPAAYTYLGQFVDHDLTFDPTSQLRESLTKAQFQALVDFRTPRFDLDNLYGRGRLITKVASGFARQRSAVGLHPVRGTCDVVEERWFRSGQECHPHQTRACGRSANR
jgi:hypothetical protein